jgi:hypothetical protein
MLLIVQGSKIPVLVLIPQIRNSIGNGFAPHNRVHLTAGYAGKQFNRFLFQVF